MGITAKPILDQYQGIELVLEIPSFSAGLNTISEDQAMKVNEARVLENWEALSIGGMIRSSGFSEVAVSDGSYTSAPDLLIQHKDTGGTEVYAVIQGDVVIKNGLDLTLEDVAAFASDVLCHGVSAGGALWVTNTTNNLKRKVVGAAMAAAAGQPPTACARIYNQKNRLLAEGSLSFPYRVYGSRVGIGNWNSANTWSLANDAFSIDLPEDTMGIATDFPSGNDDLVFTQDRAYVINNFPNVAYRPLLNSHGCGAPYSIARGDEGVFFVSRRPTLGIYLFDGVNFIRIDEFNRDQFIEKINFDERVFGIYRNQAYYLYYNETGSGVTYPNRCMKYDTRFGRWMSRPVNVDASDSFGYPALLKYSSNELYVASSQNAKLFQMEDESTSDDASETEAVYTTKDFSSKDLSYVGGGQFGLDDVRLKLEKITMTYYGLTGAIGVNWSADRGLRSGSKTFQMSSTGDLLNTTFIMNTSSLVSLPPDITKTLSFSNNAVGRRFNFSFLNSGTGVRPKIKKIKIHFLALDES